MVFRIKTGPRKTTQSIKHLLPKHEDLNSSLHTHKSHVWYHARVFTTRGVRDRKIPGACWPPSLAISKSKVGAQDVAQLAKCWSCKNGDLSLHAQYTHKEPGMVVTPTIPGFEENRMNL